MVSIRLIADYVFNNNCIVQSECWCFRERKQLKKKNKSRKLCTHPWTKFQVDTALICNVRNNYPAIRWNILNEIFFSETSYTVTMNIRRMWLWFTQVLWEKQLKKERKYRFFDENIESGVDVHTETLWMNRFACERLDVLMWK